MKKRRYEIDMTQGPILPSILRFAIPLIFADMLQLLYNAADIAVVGRFASSEALAAVSATSPIINLLTNLFIGLAMGASVLVARAFGSGDKQSLSDSVHASVALGLICGASVMALGLLFGKPMLRWTNTPDDVIGLASVYLSIYFCGSLFSMFFNCGAAILRAVGDSRRPTRYLMISGAVNVVLNLLFVVVFHMSVVGVALATVISQFLSAVLVAVSLLPSQSAVRLEVRKLRLYPALVGEQIRIGLPVGIQKSMFAISNILLQSAVNGFGAAAIAGGGAASNIEAFVYAALSGFYTANVTFTSQNMGAKKTDRMRKIIPVCLGCAVVVGLTLGSVVLMLGRPLLSIYSTDPDVIAMGLERMFATILPYTLVGISEVFVGSMRGMGKSIWPMFISIFGIVGLRTLWIYCFFPLFPSMFTLYLSYPISWGLTMVAQCVCCLIVRKRVFRQLEGAA